MDDENEIIQNICVDERLDSYATFFDHDWAQQVTLLTKNSSLKKPVGKLCASWKAAANTHIMPWLLVHSLCGVGDGILDSREPSIARFNRAYREMLFDEVPDLSNMNRRKIIAGMQRIQLKVNKGVEAGNSVRFEPLHVWEEFIEKDPKVRKELCLGIWGAQRHCFSAIYFAYEYFIQRCIGIGIGKPDRRFKEGFEQLEQHAIVVLGKAVVDRCIKCQPVQLARRVRNDIAHNGGIVEGDTTELTKAGFRIEDDEIQIMAPQNRELFHRLKVYATEVTEGTLKHLNQPAKKSSAEFEQIKQHLVGIHWIWRNYRQLFAASKVHFDLFNTGLPGFALLCHTVLLDTVVLAICRLTDKSKRQHNLTFGHLRSVLAATANQTQLAWLDSEITKIDDSVKDLSKHRHKRIAHIDIGHSLNAKTVLPPFSRNTIEEVLKLMREVLQGISDWTDNAQLDFYPNSVGEADALITYLQQAARLDELQNDYYREGMNAEKLLE